MKRLPLLLLATSTLLSLASCGEAKMDAINSLKDGFLALNTQRNYTFNYSLNNIDYKILFTDKSIGFTSDIDKTSIYYSSLKSILHLFISKILVMLIIEISSKCLHILRSSNLNVISLSNKEVNCLT